MSVSVRIPTILRNYTDGASEVTAEGTTLGEVLDDLESNHSGIKARVLDDAGEHPALRERLRRQRRRPLPRRPRQRHPRGHPDQHHPGRRRRLTRRTFQRGLDAPVRRTTGRPDVCTRWIAPLIVLAVITPLLTWVVPSASADVGDVEIASALGRDVWPARKPSDLNVYNGSQEDAVATYRNARGTVVRTMAVPPGCFFDSCRPGRGLVRRLRGQVGRQGQHRSLCTGRSLHRDPAHARLERPASRVLDGLPVGEPAGDADARGISGRGSTTRSTR